ncbi:MULTISPECIES: hypothetical protein [unclassified Methanoregula]|uniref:hypothetical protein n=1 Tax=unclassified Methanoregula TaxID=2649730 RepID=UPI0009D0FF0C|nr:MULTISPECIES: hypothetical protein [unclassified Methanoregula]OPX62064.1 MAG: hypothetical protein A4E33_02662 [Methanoregula sp. PtaB.Bin085]OPY36559.1 MAG: hypothetical protein A4E34_00253 [Methanoregula sp. PtaU1.Bin006]
MIVHLYPEHWWSKAGIVICLLWIIASPATAADIDREGYLGETITLHGYSYVGDSVYLFLTGPGLPENGVTLTNTDLRADQGYFTVVPLDDSQAWTYTWKTSRIANEINPGTYTVYVTNKPVDKAHLGGVGYKTFGIFLKDSGIPKISIEAAKVHTKKPGEQTPALLPVITTDTPTETPAVPPFPSATATTIPVQATVVPATRAKTGSFSVIVVLACCAGFAALCRTRH